MNMNDGEAHLNVTKRTRDGQPAKSLNDALTIEEFCKLLQNSFAAARRKEGLKVNLQRYRYMIWKIAERDVQWLRELGVDPGNYVMEPPAELVLNEPDVDFLHTIKVKP